MLLTLAACGGGTTAGGATTAAAATTAAGGAEAAATTAAAAPSSGGAKKTIDFWHGATGEPEKRLIARVNVYNESQDQYEVVPLSSSDTQKLVAAISAGGGPDIFTVMGESVVPYAAQGLLEPLDDYISKSGVNVDEHFDTEVLEAGVYSDKIWGFPNYNQIIGMFYNTTLLEKHGYTVPDDLPKTMEELYDIAVACTEIGDDGEMKVLGFPMYPYKAYQLEGTYAFGGDLRPQTPDGKGTPVVPEQALRLALEMNMKYRDLYGREVADRFISAAQAARGTENDPFLADQVVFMMNGLYTVQVIADYNPELKYGIMPIPGGNGEPAGHSRLENSYHAIASTAREKEGAWDFMQFETLGEGNVISCLVDIKLPASKVIAQNPDIQAARGFKEFLAIQDTKNYIPFPVFEESGRLMSLLQMCYEDVYSGAKTVDQSIEDMKTAVKEMKVE
jgi:multiple sugar transport system substrate-binding protein